MSADALLSPRVRMPRPPSNRSQRPHTGRSDQSLSKLRQARERTNLTNMIKICYQMQNGNGQLPARSGQRRQKFDGLVDRAARVIVETGQLGAYGTELPSRFTQVGLSPPPLCRAAAP